MAKQVHKTQKEKAALEKKQTDSQRSVLQMFQERQTAQEHLEKVKRQKDKLADLMKIRELDFKKVKSRCSCGATNGGKTGGGKAPAGAAAGAGEAGAAEAA